METKCDITHLQSLIYKLRQSAVVIHSYSIKIPQIFTFLWLNWSVRCCRYAFNSGEKNVCAVQTNQMPMQQSADVKGNKPERFVTTCQKSQTSKMSFLFICFFFPLTLQIHSNTQTVSTYLNSMRPLYPE